MDVGAGGIHGAHPVPQVMAKGRPIQNALKKQALQFTRQSRLSEVTVTQLSRMKFLRGGLKKLCVLMVYRLIDELRARRALAAVTPSEVNNSALRIVFGQLTGGGSKNGAHDLQSWTGCLREPVS